jgi:hypothetical protein
MVVQGQSGADGTIPLMVQTSHALMPSALVSAKPTFTNHGQSPSLKDSLALLMKQRIHICCATEWQTKSATKSLRKD